MESAVLIKNPTGKQGEKPDANGGCLGATTLLSVLVSNGGNRNKIKKLEADGY
jgi:hypothetical protein